MNRQRSGSVFVIHCVAEPGADAIRSLRWVLKTLLRRYRLRCIRIDEIPHKAESAPDAIPSGKTGT